MHRSVERRHQAPGESGGRVFQEPGNAQGTRAMTLALSTAADYLLPCNELIELTVPFNR